MTYKLTRISEGPVGDKIWWFGDYVRIRRVPAEHSPLNRREYWVEFLPTPQILRHRYELRFTWADARHIIADPIGTQP